MKTYEVLLQPRAHREFLALPPDIAKKIVQSHTDARRESPLSSIHQVVRHRALNRLRVGDYRILYEINNAAKSVTVYRIKHRREHGRFIRSAACPGELFR